MQYFLQWVMAWQYMKNSMLYCIAYFSLFFLVCHDRPILTGGVAIAEYLAESPRIIRLDLRNNDIKVAGLMALSLAFKINNSLLRLDIDKPNKKDSVSILCIRLTVVLSFFAPLEIKCIHIMIAVSPSLGKSNTSTSAFISHHLLLSFAPFRINYRYSYFSLWHIILNLQENPALPW